MCFRSNSAAKYRKEDFLHYKKIFLCYEGLLWRLEHPLPLICWVTLDKSLFSLCLSLLPSLNSHGFRFQGFWGRDQFLVSF